jgi:histone acetyltransferase 1
LSDDSFRQSNFFVQALLPFFIEAATPIEPCAFWKYFLVYNEQGLAALFTVFEAYQSADKMRLKISQVLVLPPFQRRGIASVMYQMVYDLYRQEPKCFQIVVEDAADDF